MTDDPTPDEQAVAEHCAAIFRELLDLGMTQGLDPVHERVQQLDETDREWLLMIALGHLVGNLRRQASAGQN